MLYLTRCILEMKTPLRCGAREDDHSHMSVSADAFGIWRIPGTTIAGVLRHWVRQRRGAAAEARLFASGGPDADGCSPVCISDAVLLDYDNVPVWKKITAGHHAQDMFPRLRRS